MDHHGGSSPVAPLDGSSTPSSYATVRRLVSMLLVLFVGILGWLPRGTTAASTAYAYDAPAVTHVDAQAFRHNRGQSGAAYWNARGVCFADR